MVCVVLSRFAHPRQWQGQLAMGGKESILAPKTAKKALQKAFPNTKYESLTPSENLTPDYYDRATEYAEAQFAVLSEQLGYPALPFAGLATEHPLNNRLQRLLIRYWLLDVLHSEFSHLVSLAEWLTANPNTTKLTVVTEVLTEEAIIDWLPNHVEVTVITQQSSQAVGDKKLATWWRQWLNGLKQNSLPSALLNSDVVVVDISKSISSVHCQRYLVPLTQTLLPQNKALTYLLLDEQTPRGRDEKQLRTQLLAGLPKNASANLQLASRYGYWPRNTKAITKLFGEQAARQFVLAKSTPAHLNNLWALVQRFAGFATVLHTTMANNSHADVIGMSDRVSLSLINLLRQRERVLANHETGASEPGTVKERGRVHTIQFGVPNRTFSFGDLTVDSFLVTDPYAAQVYRQQGLDTTTMPIVGSPEWTVPTSKPSPIIEKSPGECHLAFFHQPLYNGASTERQAHLDAIDSILVEWVNASPSHHLWLKPHYRESPEHLSSRFPTESHPRCHLLSPTADNGPLLATADVVVSYYSAVLATALAWGVPGVATLHLPVCQPFFQLLSDYGGYLATEPKQLEEFLNTWANDGEFRAQTQAKLVQFQTQFIQPPPLERIVGCLAD